MSTTAYAAGTSTTIDKSRTEIERTLSRYGATSFMYGWDPENAVIGFIAHGRQVRLALPLPRLEDTQFVTTPTGRSRTAAQAKAAYDAEVRRRWRALALIVKAKCEAVASGLVTFEDEWLAYTALPSGQTVGQWLEPQIDTAYATGAMPALLPTPSPREIEG